MFERALRVVIVFGLPLGCLGVIGWVASTDPPAVVIIVFVALLGGPLLGLARLQGYSDGIGWALDFERRASRQPKDRLRAALKERGDG